MRNFGTASSVQTCAREAWIPQILCSLCLAFHCRSPSLDSTQPQGRSADPACVKTLEDVGAEGFAVRMSSALSKARETASGLPN